MVQLLHFFGYLLFVIFSIPGALSYQKGAFWWTDYYDTIPDKAMEVGKSLNNKTIYIGQAYYKEPLTKKEILVPGHVESGIFAFEWGRVAYFEESHYKILCVSNPEKFEWVKTDYKGLKELESEENLIHGGFERSRKVYIGRKYTVSGFRVGKVLIRNDFYAGLHLVLGRMGRQFYDFEILSHRKQTPDIDNNIV